MLMLTVRNGDYVTLNDDVKIRFVKAGDVYKLAIDAPRSVDINRISMAEQDGGEGRGYKKSKKRYAPRQAAE
jgi:sRNA-binding carbon storage regulator CsrA